MAKSILIGLVIFVLVMCLSQSAGAQSGSLSQPPAGNQVPLEDDGTDAVTDTGFDVSSVAAGSISFSDLGVDLLTGSTDNARNPFLPGTAQDELDPSSLFVQGIILGPGIGLALVSGQLFTIGDRIGNYTIHEIKQGKIILMQLEDKYIVNMPGYSPPLKKRSANKFFVEFVEADIKMALRMLAKADNINVMIPEATTGKVTVAFNDTDPTNVIASILRVNNLEYASENNIMRVGPAEQFKDDSDLKAMSIPLRYATAKDLQDKIKTFLSERGATISDERTNIVIVKDHANVLDNVRRFLTEVDRQDPQVSIEAKIIDASKTFSRSLGIQWGLTSGPNNVIVSGVGNNAPNGRGTLVNLPATDPTSGIDVMIGRLPGNMTLETRLTAAESNGSIRIISKPNVTTINNKPAKLRSGVKIYVKVDGGADEGPTLKEIDTGIELKVTPQITLNRMVKMNIEAIQSEADFSRTVDNIPSILDNTATTTVLIPDGETAVIGGLLKVNTTSEKKSTPGIGSVPVLGWLFKNTNKSKQNKELMIFITPKILDHKYFEMKDVKNSYPEISAN